MHIRKLFLSSMIVCATFLIVNLDFAKAVTWKDYDKINLLNLNNEKIYHHIGIYAFTNIALTKYVKFARSKLEIERNLEQMRAMENNMVIKVGLTDSMPLSIDTEKDLECVESNISLI